MEEKQIEDEALVAIIHNKDELYEAYMPFIQQGGLFIATQKQFQLRSEVRLTLKLFDEPEKISVLTQVVWITPTCAQDGRRAGVGLQFLGDQAKMIQTKIETILSNYVHSNKKTDTM